MEGFNRGPRQGGFNRGGSRDGDRGGFNRGGDRGGSRGGFNKSFGPRTMHPAKCSECGVACEVPFKPTEGKPVFCRDCYNKKKERSN